MPYQTDDTIVAIATPPGHGGIGVVRVSGPRALAIGCQLAALAEAPAPRVATFVRLRDEGSLLDHAVVTCFPSPRSYTGDDVVELSVHGSPVVLRRVVVRAMAAGARLAEPGEFTLRAYLNGRIDLIQAEAVADLVAAVTPSQARAAMDQLDGTLTSRIAAIDARVFDLSARLEASLDFPEEGFHFLTADDAAAELAAIAAGLDDLVRQGRGGQLIREGRTVAIIGPPNAGKSSLFNALVGAERAIVTAVPGTTRDLVTECVDLGGVPVTLVDTAGLRATDDEVEREGVWRARRAADAAALTLIAIDGAEPLSPATRQLVRAGTNRRVVVATKADLPPRWPPGDLAPEVVVPASVRTGHGLDEVRSAIVAGLTGGEAFDEAPVITNARHIALVETALEAVGRARAALAGAATEELVLVDLAVAREALEEVAGRRAPDDLLVHIFSRFCIGK